MGRHGKGGTLGEHGHDHLDLPRLQRVGQTPRELTQPTVTGRPDGLLRVG
jgi:hypothetical protein